MKGYHKKEKGIGIIFDDLFLVDGENEGRNYHKDFK